MFYRIFLFYRKIIKNGLRLTHNITPYTFVTRKHKRMKQPRKTN